MDTKAPDNQTTQFYRLYEHLVLRARNGGHPERSGKLAATSTCAETAHSIGATMAFVRIY